MNKPLLLSVICSPSLERPEPLYVQIYRDVMAALHSGQLEDGFRLPSSRKAAEVLQVSRTTIVAAYDLLRAEGVMRVKRGAPPRLKRHKTPHIPTTRPSEIEISARGQHIADNPRAEAGLTDEHALSPGVPSSKLFPADEWARFLRRASRKSYGAKIMYEETYGLSELRSALARRLTADRGIVVSPDQIVITPGTQASLSLLSQVLADVGDVAALEDPGYLGARAAFQGAGLRIHPMEVGEAGIQPKDLPSNARVAYVTPSNQYPFGTRLSNSRRLELLAIAKANGTVLIEDDYDSEFLWRGSELAPLFAQDESGQVIFVSSASKVLIPGIRIGWIVLPHSLIDPVRSAHRNFGMMVNVHAQAALAEFMDTGRYRAQLRRILKFYDQRGHALAEALSTLDGVTVKLPNGGVQIVIELDDTWSETTCVHHLSERGFCVAKLSTYCIKSSHSGLVIGFAGATPQRTSSLIAALGEAPRLGLGKVRPAISS